VVLAALTRGDLGYPRYRKEIAVMAEDAFPRKSHFRWAQRLLSVSATNQVARPLSARSGHSPIPRSSVVGPLLWAAPARLPRQRARALDLAAAPFSERPDRGRQL
jgi:hypothetical protein